MNTRAARRQGEWEQTAGVRSSLWPWVLGAVAAVCMWLGLDTPNAALVTNWVLGAGLAGWAFQGYGRSLLGRPRAALTGRRRSLAYEPPDRLALALITSVASMVLYMAAAFLAIVLAAELVGYPLARLPASDLAWTALQGGGVATWTLTTGLLALRISLRNPALLRGVLITALWLLGAAAVYALLAAGH
jgi:hypothetical protein